MATEQISAAVVDKSFSLCCCFSLQQQQQQQQQQPQQRTGINPDELRGRWLPHLATSHIAVPQKPPGH